MNSEGSRLLFVTSSVAELSWLSALAIFSTASIGGGPIPLLTMIGTFLLAVLLTRVSTGKGLRIIEVIGIRVLGLVCAGLCTIYVRYYGSSPLLSREWLAAFFTSPRSPVEWLGLVLLLLWTLLFWWAGAGLARRKADYFTLCTRFDIGLAAFFALFLTKLLVLVKGGTGVDEPSHLFVYSFFLFSLLSIGMVRIRRDAPRDFLPGYRGVGIIASFAAAVFICAGGVMLFLLPALSVAAETGYLVLKGAAGPVGYIFLGLVRFWLMPRGSRNSAPAGEPKGPDWEHLQAAEPSWWMEMIGKIVAWGLGSLLFLGVLVACAFLVYLLFRWLFSRTSQAEKKDRQRHFSWRRLADIWALFRSLPVRLARSMRGYQSAAGFFAALLIWGRHSGLSRLRSETPMEFGSRLARRFPAVRAEVASIVGAFNEEVYGEHSLRSDQLASTRSAWRVLRSPVHWPSRFKAWFLRPDPIERA